jgi:hypothetical protein
LFICIVGTSIGQRNKDASKAYKNVPSTATEPQSQPLTNNINPDAEERSVFKKKTKPIKQLHAEVASWASDIQKKVCQCVS